MRRGHKKKGQPKSKTNATISTMLPADFRYIVKNLSVYWSSGKRERLLDNRSISSIQELHSPFVYYEYGNMSLVQKNERGDIEGYLIGYISPCHRNYGVIHTCAIMESKRSPEAIRPLLNEFEHACEQQSAQLLRLLIRSTYEKSIKFYMKLGFTADSVESKEVADAIPGTIALVKTIS